MVETYWKIQPHKMKPGTCLLRSIMASWQWRLSFILVGVFHWTGGRLWGASIILHTLSITDLPETHKPLQKVYSRMRYKLYWTCACHLLRRFFQGPGCVFCWGGAAEGLDDVTRGKIKCWTTFIIKYRKEARKEAVWGSVCNVCHLPSSLLSCSTTEEE